MTIFSKPSSDQLRDLSSSWEADSFSTSQEVSGILGNPKIHCDGNKSRLLIHVQTQMIPANTPPSYIIHSFTYLYLGRISIYA